jgi:hypothetical protein
MNTQLRFAVCRSRRIHLGAIVSLLSECDVNGNNETILDMNITINLVWNRSSPLEFR